MADSGILRGRTRMSNQSEDRSASQAAGGQPGVTTAAQDAAEEEGADLIKSAAGESGVAETESAPEASTPPERP
jgi:hypothetical protein